MINYWKFFLAVCFFGAYIADTDGNVVTKLPPYIHSCKRNDPKLNQCFKKFFESFESKFTTGIPEIGLPVMDPLKVEHLTFKLPGSSKNRLESFDNLIYGLKNMKLQEVSLNPESLEIKLKCFVGFLSFKGRYDVDADIFNMKLKGKGAHMGNGTDIQVNCTVKAKVIDKEGARVLHVENADGDVSWKKEIIQIDNLFPDKKANDAVNKMINSPAGESMVRKQSGVFKPFIMHTLLEYLNQIVERFPIELILPEK